MISSRQSFLSLWLLLLRISQTHINHRSKTSFHPNAHFVTLFSDYCLSFSKFFRSPHSQSAVVDMKKKTCDNDDDVLVFSHQHFNIYCQTLNLSINPKPNRVDTFMTVFNRASLNYDFCQKLQKPDLATNSQHTQQRKVDSTVFITVSEASDFYLIEFSVHHHLHSSINKLLSSVSNHVNTQFFPESHQEWIDSRASLDKF